MFRSFISLATTRIKIESLTGNIACILFITCFLEFPIPPQIRQDDYMSNQYLLGRHTPIPFIYWFLVCRIHYQKDVFRNYLCPFYIFTKKKILWRSCSKTTVERMCPKAIRKLSLPQIKSFRLWSNIFGYRALRHFATPEM